MYFAIRLSARDLPARALCLNWLAIGIRRLGHRLSGSLVAGLWWCQIRGGRPSRVIRHTVRYRIGWRGPHGVRAPSRNPAAHVRKAAVECVLATVIVIHTPRYAGTSTAGRRRLASHTRFRAVIR